MRGNKAVQSANILVSWAFFKDYLLILVGAALLGVSMQLFFIPSQLVAGRLSGAAQIINSFTGLPIGVLIFLGNVPWFVFPIF
jgi:uncharacterized membrane-anchored protein YitT (DUF2179 family)